MIKKLIVPAIVILLMITVLWTTFYTFNRNIKAESESRTKYQESLLAELSRNDKFHIVETEDGKFRPMLIRSRSFGNDERCIDHNGMDRGARYQDSCLFDTKEEALAAIHKYDEIFNTRYEFAKPKRIIPVE